MSDEEKVITLSAKRAEQTGNAKDWTVLDALREAIKDIEAGEYKPLAVAILLYSDEGDGQRGFPYVVAGANHLETIGLIELQKDQIIRRSKM